MDEVQKILDDIRALRVQGARNVALAALKAVKIVAERSSDADLVDNVKNVVLELARTRPTEPAMRDALTYVLRHLSSKEELLKAIDRYEDEIREAEEKIADYGARRVPDGGVVITHCHSTTVVRVLTRAKEVGKEFRVVVTETRPKYQGKITARELLEAGIPVTYIVDSAAYLFMRDADLYITGADAITSDGYVVNKIGTALMALAAKRFDVPYCVAASTLKYDPVTAAGFEEPIEERDPSEVVDPSELPGAEIRNPAFDVTPPDLVDGIISEIGVYAPQIFPAMVAQQKGVSDLEEVIALFELVRQK
ncbi:MAG: ribose 1,5-bisphosphate isomerase [Candidatus Diapherotrites archaeon]|nr:ribose 1,5-bisphosphate isomerase [Candidatus Diapherotrites archaeon]MDN5367247.1 ribose 1,5-bisphosphate isomerase [Candidatus Diapherotrites archaeon]